MEKLEIAICDNERFEVDYLHDFIKDYFDEKRRECNIRISTNSSDFFEFTDKYDIVFLDIDMDENDINGIEIGKLLRNINKHALLIYITGYKEYVFVAQDNNCFHYLLKPINDEKLYNTLNTAMEYMFKKRKKIIFFSKWKRIDLFPEEIYYFEFRNKNISVKTDNHKYVINIPKEEVLRTIDVSDYAYTHQNYLVNMLHVKDVEKEFIALVNDEKIPLSNRRTKEFRERFTMWLAKLYMLN